MQTGVASNGIHTTLSSEILEGYKLWSNEFDTIILSQSHGVDL